MKKFTIILAAQLFSVVALRSVGAQQQPRPVFSTDPAAERIPNLDKLKEELEHYHDCICTCGCYSHDLDVQANRAMEFLHRAVARRDESRKSVPKEKLALILDIDDTTLSTYPEMLKAGFAYNPAVFDAWVQTAQAPAIPGTLRLLKEALRLGVNIFFVTGRSETERAATERNLRAQGFTGWNLLVMRPVDHGNQTIDEFKAATRAQIATAGYTLGVNVGDQWSDLKGKPEAEYSVKYPDPFYFIP